jgi:hypothetical protein
VDVCSGNGLYDSRDGSRFVFWWRMLPTWSTESVLFHSNGSQTEPTFERIHDVPGLSVMNDASLVEGDIYGRGRSRRG